MKSIELNIQDALKFAEKEYDAMGPEAVAALKTVEEGTGLGNDFLGWVRLPEETPAELVASIEATAKRLRENCDYVVCIGIGGSYLGAKAVNTALESNFDAYYAPTPGNPKVLYAGQNIGEEYTAQLERPADGQAVRYNRDLQVRNYHRTCHRLPYPEGTAGEAGRQG